MKRLLPTLSVALLLAFGLVAVLRTQETPPRRPLPMLEPIPVSPAREVLVRADEPSSAASDSAALAQQCRYDPDASLAELELAPAQGEATAAPREMTLRRAVEIESPAEPEQSFSADTFPARPPIRLPPIPENDPPAIKLAPPQTIAENGTREEVAKQVLLHAGGAIEAEFPDGWKVFEVTAGRRVYAVLLPAEAEAPTEYPHDGIWFSHIAQPTRRPWSQESLSEELARRLSALPGKPMVIQSNPPSMLGPWESQSVVYQLSEADPSRSEGQAQQQQTLGGFMLVRTAWGLVEINAVAPRSAYSSRQAAYQQVLRSVKLEAPSVPKALAPQVKEARELLGSWKGSQSRIRLHGDARFEVLLDPSRPVAIHPPADPRERPPVRRLIGVYHTRDDVIFVDWHDGSQSNYRWVLNDGELLLTDHEGRISRLSRLYE